jgi:hypothetical protein
MDLSLLPRIAPGTPYSYDRSRGSNSSGQREVHELDTTTWSCPKVRVEFEA